MDNQGRSRTQILEETIARLESHIEELENPVDSDALVLLQDPLVAFRRPTSSLQGSPLSDGSSPAVSASPSLLLSQSRLRSSSQAWPFIRRRVRQVPHPLEKVAYPS